MRIADVLMSSGDDFSGGPMSFNTAHLRSRRPPKRTREKPLIWSPLSLLFCWLSAKNSKGQGMLKLEVNSEIVERQSRSHRLDRGFPRSNGKASSSSYISELEEEGDIAKMPNKGKHSKDSFNLAIGCGLVYLITKTKNELNEIIKMRTEMETLLENVKEAFQNKMGEIPSDSSKSNEVHACSTIDTQENIRSNGDVTLQDLFYEDPADSEISESHDQSLTCKGTRQEKCMKSIEQLEAELEAELENLQLHLVRGYISEYPKQQILEDTASGTSMDHCRYGEVVDPPVKVITKEFGVSSTELERKLHELIESRQQQRIEELEAALESANQKLREKERGLLVEERRTTHFSAGS